MLVIIIIFVLAAAASLRSSYVYSKAEDRGASTKSLNRVGRFGAAYSLVMILTAFSIVGTLETSI